MARRFTEDRLVIASHNPGKVSEISDLLAPWSIAVVSAAELDLPEPEETGLTFKANAKLKSDAAAFVANLPALAKATPNLLEVSIGHGLTADALEYGMAESVKRFVAALNVA